MPLNPHNRMERTRQSHPAFEGEAYDRTLAVAFADDSIVETTPLGGESANLVAAVTVGSGERYVLKCAPPAGSGASLMREWAVTEYVDRKTAVPVPEVVAADTDPPGRAMPFLVTHWADGQPLRDQIASTPRPLQAELFKHLGEVLATLHTQTSFDTPGKIVTTDPPRFEIDAAGSWGEQFARQLAHHVERLDGTRFEALAEDVWEHVSERLQTLETGCDPVLLHGDVGDGNVTYHGTDLSRLLDWEMALVGHPEFDLCRTEVRCFWSQWGASDPLQSALYDGYQSVRDLPPGFESRRRCYLATFYLQSLSTYEQWAPDLTDDLEGFAESLADKVHDLMSD